MKSKVKYLKVMLSVFGVAAVALCLFASQAAAATKYVVKDGKKFVELDGKLFPALAVLRPPPIPKDNPQTLDKNGWPLMNDPKVQLGYKLFFEPALSGDGSVACSTCHKPDEGWSLNSAISRGYPGISHWVNSQTVVNSGQYGRLFWDGHALSLESQAPSAAQGLSGNGKADMMEQRLYQVPAYRKSFKAIFGSDRNMVKDSWRAIAAFQRAMNQPDTPFDKYLLGDKKALTEQQVKGMVIFEGKGRCIACHNGHIFTDEKYYNIGLPLQPLFLEDPIKQAGHRSQTYIRGVPEAFFRKTKFMSGLYMQTHRKQDIGKFRTAPLRYLEFTPPYMHSGVFDDLAEVVEFYSNGGFTDETKGKPDKVMRFHGIDNKTKQIKKLDLTDEEKEDLVSFLESLTGEEIILPRPKLPKPEVMN